MTLTDSPGGGGARWVLTVDEGLPPTKANWPDGVLAALRTFAQGDVVSDPPLFYWADPARAVWARTQAYTNDSPGPEVIESGQEAHPRYGLITTQTCDIGEEEADNPVRPWVQLSPVYDLATLPGDMRSLLKAGKGRRYLLHLPNLPDGFWVADLRLEVPVEKGWLANKTPIDAFGSELIQRGVGQRLALLRQRPAFAGVFVDAVQKPLVDSLRDLRKTNRSLYDELDLCVDEVTVDLDDHLDPTSARLMLITTQTLSTDVEEWWSEWWDHAFAAASSKGFTLHAFDVRTQAEIRLDEYKRVTAVPLDRLSPD